jgi:hypothetical protein
MSDRTILSLSQQADLRRNGLLAEAEHLWASPCGRFVLKPRDPNTKARHRLNLGVAAR